MGENLHWEYDDFEFDNRVTNLMWTICGDYKEQMSSRRKPTFQKYCALLWHYSRRPPAFYRLAAG